MWQHAFEGWQASPLMGNGWSSFIFIWPNHVTVSGYSHNELLGMLYETGLVGAVIGVSCMAISLIMTMRLLKAARSLDFELHLRISFGLQLYHLIYGFTMGNIMTQPIYYGIYILAVAISLAIYCNSGLVPERRVLGRMGNRVSRQSKRNES